MGGRRKFTLGFSHAIPACLSASLGHKIIYHQAAVIQVFVKSGPGWHQFFLCNGSAGVFEGSCYLTWIWGAAYAL